jgi:hypothetical protein
VSAVVSRRFVGLSARVLWRDAMTSNDVPPGATGLGIWGNLGIWIAGGALLGALVGVLFDNVALGTSLGLSLGLVVHIVFIARRNVRGES